MALSNLGYSLREAGHHFKRSWSTVIGAVVTIFLSLFIIGMFLLGSVMLDNLVGSVEDQVTIQAFLSDEADQAAVDSFQAELESWGNVESVAYKSKDEALEEYRTTMSHRNAAEAVAALEGENPLPASLVLTLDDPQQVEATADKLIADESFKAICDDPDSPASSVQYGRGTVEKLFSVTSFLRVAALVLVALLTFVAFVFINNTIRLAITARRREIAIMRLVGASNSFIRGPFVAEGVLEAIIGTVCAVLALHFGMKALLPRIAASVPLFNFSVEPRIELATYAVLLLVGLVIGFFGSVIAMRRYLKV